MIVFGSICRRFSRKIGPGGSRKASRTTPGGLRETLRHASVTDLQKVALPGLRTSSQEPLLGSFWEAAGTQKSTKNATLAENGVVKGVILPFFFVFFAFFRSVAEFQLDFSRKKR